MQEGDVRGRTNDVRSRGRCPALNMRLLLLLLLLRMGMGMGMGMRQLDDSAAVVRRRGRHVVEDGASWQVVVVMSWHGGGVDVGRVRAGHGNASQLLVTQLLHGIPVATAMAAATAVAAARGHDGGCHATASTRC